jgi:hypothetical protein
MMPSVNKASRLAMRSGYLLVLPIVGMWIFFAEIFENYVGLLSGKDTFYLGMIFPLFLIVFLLIGLVSLVRSLVVARSLKRASFGLALIICAVGSFYYHRELISLGDRSFFALNNGKFSEIVLDRSVATPSVVFKRSAYNSQKLILYSGSSPLSDGPLPSSVRGIIGVGMDDTECRFNSIPLGHNFYFFTISC